MSSSQNPKRLLTLLLMGSLVAPVSLHAQDEEGGRVERLEVTGSHIRRIDVEGPSPVQVIDRKALDNTGYNSVSDVLRDITAVSFGGAREASGSTAAGVATIGLRGLGASRTLVLLDGKRLPTDAVSQAVDMNLIPMASVERIDVLKDGASATYGSDALGGVINIITRKDFNGTEISGRTSFNKYEGGERTNLSLINGTATNKSRVITVFNYRNNERIYSKDRPWSDSGFSNFAEPANFSATDSIADNATYGGLTAPTNCTNLDSSGLCQFKFSDFSDEVPSMEQFSIMSQFSYDINPDLTYYARLMATRTRVEWQYAPAADFYSISNEAGAADFVTDFAALRTAAGAPGTSRRILVYDRLTPLGPRKSEIEGTAIGLQTGLKGYLFDTWSWDVSYDYNFNRRHDSGISGYAYKANLVKNIGTGANQYNPFATAGNRDPGAALKNNSVLYQPWDTMESLNHFLEAKASGELFYLAGRPVALAIGATYLYDQYNIDSDSFTKNGEVLGSAGGTGGAKRNAVSTYTELALTPLENLEVQAAGRFDNYNDFGSTVNPKLGFRWQPTQPLMIRGSVGTGFKAPTLQELYSAQSQGNPTFKDEFYCANGPASDTRKCNAQQWRVLSGGNPNLKEEKSLSYNVGSVYQLARRTSFGLDFWGIDLEDAIGGNLRKFTEAEQKFGNQRLRDAGIIIERDANNRIRSMTALNSNLATSKLMGLDFMASHGFTTFLGDISLKMEHSHMLKYTNEFFPGLGEESLFDLPGAPRWRNNITVGYVPEFHPASSFYLVAKTTAKNFKEDPTKGELDRYTEFDFQYNYSAPWNGQLTVGVINLFGSTPPLDETLPSSTLNAELYNPFGQSAYVQYTQSF